MKKKVFVKLTALMLTAVMLLLGGCSDYEEYALGDRNGTSSNASTASGVLYDSDAVREHRVQLLGNGEDTITLMVYMNGSNLESDDGAATEDLKEIVAGAGISDKVNILVQTMGTKSWSSTYNINPNHTQRFKVDQNGLALVDDSLGQLDCTNPDTLRDFIKWGAANYPANRYMLVFWDHGGGPVYGFGYDEWVSDYYAALTIDEMQQALNQAGVFFDFIGMDCCLMSCLEICCAIYDYCDYSVLSEDFESGLGWSYSGWISTLYQNTSTDTITLGTQICDDMVYANETEQYGDDSTMALIDEALVKVLYTAWKDFAYANEDTLLDSNYGQAFTQKEGGRSGWIDDLYDYYTDDSDSDDDDVSMLDYYCIDIMAAATMIDSAESEALKSALNNTLTYYACTEGDSHLTGMAVSLPYGDSDYYNDMVTIYTNIGMDSDYISWLGNFVNASGSDNYYDYGDFEDDWDGWDDYDDDYDWNGWLNDFWDDYDEDDYGFSYWDYEDSYNSWYNDDDWYYSDDYDDYYYGGSNWYYDDDYDDYYDGCDDCDDDWWWDF